MSRPPDLYGHGLDINVHDQWAVESMGAIQDRTREHLGQSDKAIVQYRRLLRQEIEGCRRHRGRYCSLMRRTHAPFRGRPRWTALDRRAAGNHWMEVDVKRRRGAPWAAPVPAEIAEKVPHLTAAE
jgi:hypothetical protein